MGYTLCRLLLIKVQNQKFHECTNGLAFVAYLVFVGPSPNDAINVLSINSSHPSKQA